MIVPTVTVLVNGKQHVQALLDSGSTTTFCSQKLVETLGVRGRNVKYTLNTISKAEEDKECKVVSLTLMSEDGVNQMRLSNEDVYVTKEIKVNVPNIDVDNYGHLRDISFRLRA